MRNNLRRVATFMLLAFVLAACASSHAVPPPSMADEQLVGMVKAALAADTELAQSAITVAAQDGTVTLRGEVSSDAMRDRATFIAGSLDGVRNVINDIAVK